MPETMEAICEITELHVKFYGRRMCARLRLRVGGCTAVVDQSGGFTLTVR